MLVPGEYTTAAQIKADGAGIFEFGNVEYGVVAFNESGVVIGLTDKDTDIFIGFAVENGKVVLKEHDINRRKPPTVDDEIEALLAELFRSI